MTAAPVIPPVDPASPDELEHQVYVHVAVDEYLKGRGPTELRLLTSTGYLFFEGRLGTRTQTESLLDESSIGKRYVLMLPPSADAPRDPGSCGGSAELTGPSGDEHLQRIRAILATTAGLPAVGGTPRTTDPTAPAVLTAGGILLLVAGAFAFRRLAR